MTKRAAIGRKMPSVSLSSDTDQEFTLKSGKTARFQSVTVEAAQLEDQTFVNFEVNGREQEGLSPESLADIRRTIGKQQFFKAIGRRDPKTKTIEILDGSRRRKAALLEGVGLQVLVTDDAISNSDAKQLAKDIQTAKEHNFREKGMRYKVMEQSGLTQTEIASLEGHSQGYISKCMKAAGVPLSILALFPDWNLLSINDYGSLYSIAQNRSENDLAPMVERAKENAVEIDSESTPEDYKSELMLIWTKLSKDESVQTKKTPPENLLTAAKGKFSAIKKQPTVNKDVYEFNKLPAEVRKELDKVIRSTLSKHYVS